MEAKANLETKLKQLLITSGRTNAVLETNEDIAIQRQTEALKALSSDVENARRAVEAQKIADDEEEIEIGNWNTQIEAKLAKADNEVKRLQKWQDDCKQEKERIMYARSRSSSSLSFTKQN